MSTTFVVKKQSFEVVILYKKYEQLLVDNNTNTSRVSKATGIDKSVFSKWKKGVYTPKRDKIKLVADYFNVPISYFYDDEEVDKAWEEHKESIDNLSKDDLIDMLVESLFESANIATADTKEAYRNEMRVFSDYLLARIEKDGNEHKD